MANQSIKFKFSIPLWYRTIINKIDLDINIRQDRRATCFDEIKIKVIKIVEIIKIVKIVKMMINDIIN